MQRVFPFVRVKGRTAVAQVMCSVGQRCSWNVASTTQILEAVETKTKIKQQWEKQISR
jgi:hypothetical protein